jgi:flagellar basal-body rod protein FlgB
VVDLLAESSLAGSEPFECHDIFPPGVAMIDQLTKGLEFQSRALALRAERQKVLAANIANADTPNFKARDIDFSAALQRATAGTGSTAPNGQLVRTDARHLVLNGGPGSSAPMQQIRTSPQGSFDGNTVDMDAERMHFADNAVRYEATLRFINGHVRTMLSAIRGDQG